MKTIIRKYVSFELLGSILFLSLLWVRQLWSEDRDFMSSFNVLDYGAIGDGIIDDTLAFEMTWESTCNAETDNAEMIVPKGKTFLVHTLVFDGPCNPTKISFSISGNIVAPDSPDAWEGRDKGQWLIFDSVNGLDVNGPGTIDGRGQGWWDISCKTRPQSTGCVKLAPTVLSFLQCNKVSMINISVVNSPQTHILISGCDDFAINSLSIRSPGKSPNTDGIHISSSHGILITSTNIASGDDCVSIGDHTSNIHISDVNCGPGHGVSIGSLGKSGNEVKVENISVIRGHFNRTTNGVRIKTWQVGRGHVRGVSFKSIDFTDVKNPIIIDQYYCDVRGACKPTFLYDDEENRS
ncbi:probable polygalacturonase At1g80170 isoform X2 [Rhododendron vialii]|uniref:probable polygalacturonase At1g80170 isoform X2 n=1 Tax=Rhododendron vialii TaxID=182163 RepID=UPI00265D6251|nr:probable polygalacturonase At1g80170 isoform X2 [Rhododendron vialii]